MAIVNVSDFGKSIVLHFQTDSNRINAYTLASTLVALADAAKAANATVNPGYDVEVVVEALGGGSFRAQIGAIYKSARNIFSKDNLKTVILSIIAAYIFQRTLSDDVKITVNANEVIIEHGNDRVIVPREIYDAKEAAQKSPEFRNSIAKTLAAVAEDRDISGVGFVKAMKSPAPEIVISRETIEAVAIRTEQDPDEKTEFEQCDLYIIRAILERGRRKWEFMWRGVKISAPVLDDEFYARFVAHKVTIAPGDRLRVRLSIKQRREPTMGIYTNVGYEVVEVMKHIPGVQQMGLGSE